MSTITTEDRNGWRRSKDPDRPGSQATKDVYADDLRLVDALALDMMT